MKNPKMQICPICRKAAGPEIAGKPDVYHHECIAAKMAESHKNRKV